MKNLILFLTIIGFIGCTGKPDQYPETQVDLMSAPAPAQEKPLAGNVDKSAVSRKLVKDGEIEFETADIDKTKSQITAAVAASGGYVSSDQENKMADKRTYTLAVRVPAAKFDQFLSEATKDVQYFDRKQISVKDVTAEYLDSETRLKTKKEIEARYLQLLNKASGVKDILEIEKELGEVRTEIESAEGQLKLLNDEIQYSSLVITFYKTDSAPSLFSHQIKTAFVTGWENLMSFLIIVIDLWPFVLLGAALWYGVTRFKKKKPVVKQTESV